jgi:hypothetical protein
MFAIETATQSRDSLPFHLTFDQGITLNSLSLCRLESNGDSMNENCLKDSFLSLLRETVSIERCYSVHIALITT